MEGVKISLAQVSQCASEIRSCSQVMADSLERMRREVSATSGNWISEGGEAIRTRFQTFAGHFENQRQMMESYAQFLERTVESYDSLESTIISNAAGIQA